jgi:hypothetical protein
MENRTKNEKDDQPSTPAPIPAVTADHNLSNLEGSLSCYLSETAGLGRVFTLQDLFSVFQMCDFPHPHLTIRSLKEQGFLVSDGEGRFSWKE